MHAPFAAEIMQIAVGADIVPAAELGIGKKGFAQVGGKIFYMVLQLAGSCLAKKKRQERTCLRTKPRRLMAESQEQTESKFQRPQRRRQYSFSFN